MGTRWGLPVWLRQIKDSNHNRNGRPKRTHSNESKGDYQRDDPGLRIGQRARSPESAKWLVGGASIFRGRMSQIQAEGYWENVSARYMTSKSVDAR
jgi:hypothetical protein